MCPRVLVVTDSTADLSPETVAAQGISVVPLGVTAGSSRGLEGIDIGPQDVVEALKAHLQVGTSQPGPAAFSSVYAEAHGGAVSIHLSGRLSGTYESACHAADQMENVRVIDSKSISMGLGFVVLAAARAAAEGADLEGVVSVAERAASRITVMFSVETLEFLRRGGRIGAASALLGTALSVKPVLELDDGAISVRERVRTTANALDRLATLAAAAAGSGPADLAVLHLDSPLRAAELARRLSALRSPHEGDAPVLVREVGAAIGVHGGPGLFGVAVHRR